MPISLIDDDDMPAVLKVNILDQLSNCKDIVSTCSSTRVEREMCNVENLNNYARRFNDGARQRWKDFQCHPISYIPTPLPSLPNTSVWSLPITSTKDFSERCRDDCKISQLIEYLQQICDWMHDRWASLDWWFWDIDDPVRERLKNFSTPPQIRFEFGKQKKGIPIGVQLILTVYRDGKKTLHRYEHPRNICAVMNDLDLLDALKTDALNKPPVFDKVEEFATLCSSDGDDDTPKQKLKLNLWNTGFVYNSVRGYNYIVYNPQVKVW